MKRLRMWPILFLLTVLLSSLAIGQANPPVNTIQMTAKRYEFTPREIHVKQGETVRLVITAMDHNHGIQIKEFNIKEKLPKGETKTVEFVAKTKGTFEFHCSEFCGIGHHGMKGKIIVE